MTDSLLHRLLQQIDAMPDALAFDGPLPLSYRQFGQRVASLEARLREPTRRNGPIVILARDPVIASIAIVASIAAERQFACVDPLAPNARLQQQVSLLQPAVVMFEASAARLANHLSASSASRMLCDPYDEPGGPAHIRVAPRIDAGYITFTSGTTGAPKAITASLRAVAHFVDWEASAFNVSIGTRVSALSAPVFDAFLRDLFTPLCSGGTVCVPAEAERVQQGLYDWLRSADIEILHTVPTIFRTLRAARGVNKVSRLRAVLLAGETVRASDVAWWRGEVGERIALVNLYGPSETTMVKFYRRLDDTDTKADVVPVGRPLPGVTVEIEHVRAGVGEIVIRTPFYLGGYLGTEQGGFDPSDRCRYRTGDIGTIREDGELIVLGRRDRLVKVGGLRIELSEIEQALAAHPTVRDVRVVVLNLGDQDQLCAYVVADAFVSEDSLRELATAVLAPGHVPSWFIVLDDLPKTVTGKVDESRLPPPHAVEFAAAGGVLRNETERAVAEVWEELLKIPIIGYEANFVLLGGDSRTLLMMLDAVRSRFGAEVSISAFLETPTLAWVADQIARLHVDDQSTVRSEI